MPTVYDVEREAHDEYAMHGNEQNVFNQIMEPNWLRKLLNIWVLVMVVAITTGILVAIVLFRWNNERNERAALADKAEAVLTARFIDNDVDDLVSMEVRVDDDNLVASWTTGRGNNQKTCTALVQVSKDEQLFGIEPIKQLSFSKQDTADAYCVQTAGLKYGLPLDS
jgi:hypothetical protein